MQSVVENLISAVILHHVSYKKHGLTFSDDLKLQKQILVVLFRSALHLRNRKIYIFCETKILVLFSVAIPIMHHHAVYHFNLHKCSVAELFTDLSRNLRQY